MVIFHCLNLQIGKKRGKNGESGKVGMKIASGIQLVSRSIQDLVIVSQDMEVMKVGKE